VVVDASETQVFKREMLQAFKPLVGRQRSPADFFQEVQNLL